MRGISCLAVELLAFQAGLCFMKFVSYLDMALGRPVPFPKHAKKVKVTLK